MTHRNAPSTQFTGAIERSLLTDSVVSGTFRMLRRPDDRATVRQSPGVLREEKRVTPVRREARIRATVTMPCHHKVTSRDM